MARESLHALWSSVAVAALIVAQTAAAADTVATLTQLSGDTLVNQGAEYVTAAPDMSLHEGDRVMTLEGASATLKYADGCEHTLDPNTIFTVGDEDICTAGALLTGAHGTEAALPGAAGNTSGMVVAGAVGTVAILGAALPTGSDDNQGSGQRALSP